MIWIIQSGHTKWNKAIDTELTKFETINCFQFIPDTGQHLVPMMWLFNIKTDGTKKARLVGRGDMMIPLVDFDPDAVYCGNVAACSIKIAVTIAGMYCLVMRGGDLVGAYLITWANPGFPVSSPTWFRNKGHRQSIRFSTRSTELLYRVRQVPCGSRIWEHPMGPQALRQVDSCKETNYHHSTHSNGSAPRRTLTNGTILSRYSASTNIKLLMLLTRSRRHQDLYRWAVQLLHGPES